MATMDLSLAAIQTRTFDSASASTWSAYPPEHRLSGARSWSTSTGAASRSSPPLALTGARTLWSPAITGSATNCGCQP